MKKSQTLAALALAFALGLGVVAPAANTYAKLATEGVTAEQATEVSNLTTYANLLAGSTENLDNYVSLYNAIESAKTQLNEIAATQLDTYSEKVALANSPLNTRIQKAISITSLGFDKANLKEAIQEQATPVALSQLGSASDLASAYAGLQTLVSNVNKNLEVLTENYDETKDAVIALDQAYDDILESANYWIDQIEEAFKNVTVPAYVGNNFKAINESAWNTLINSTAYKDAAKNADTKGAAEWGMIANAAKALPKYNDVASVVNAKVNYDRIDANNQVVDYAQAKSYANAYINAIMAFRGETTNPTDPEVSSSVRTLTSGNVTVVAYLPNDVTLHVAEVPTNVFGDKAHAAYDISFMRGDAKYTFTGNAVVTIKTGKLDASKSSAYYVEGNNATALNTTRGEGYVTFTATHFSVYAVVEDGKEQPNNGSNGSAEDPSAPGTGVVSSAEGNAATTVSIIAGLATALTALGAGVVAYRNARRSSEK